jgi:hypothetical protein
MPVRALSACPVEAPAPPQLPFAKTAHVLPAYWLDKLSPEKRNTEVLSRSQIEAHNRTIQGLRKEGWLRGRWDLLTLDLKPARIKRRLDRSLEALRKAVKADKRVLADGSPPLALIDRLEREHKAMTSTSELRVAHQSSALRCYPTEVGVFEKAHETAFDLMQCAQVRVGEPVRVLGKGRTYWYVWTSYAEGWVKPAALTPALSEQEAQAFLKPKHRAMILRDQEGLRAVGDPKLAAVRMGAALPLLEQRPDRLKVSLPTPTGLKDAWIPRGPGVGVDYAPLTRAGLWQRAFSLLNAPYGWGGLGDHRDCSRLLMDLFATSGLMLPRNSSRQSVAGTRHVDVDALDDAAKMAAIEQAAQRAVVLLYLPGHIMLYLGRDGEQLYALHQFSGYLVPCDGKAKTEGGRETMMRVNRTVVTSLELGRGSSRRSFLERVTRLVLLESSEGGAGVEKKR